jgi:uncharacterized membrane protein
MRWITTLARWAAKGFFALSCLGVGAYAFAYLYGEYRSGDPFAAQFAVSGVDVPLHFFAAGLALVLAPLQLAGWVRRRAPRLHRLAGWTYMAAILVGGVSGLSLSFEAQGGPLARAGFFTLALLWPLVTAQGVRSAVAGDHVRHREWMSRSVALTFGAVTLRVMLVVGFGMLDYPFMVVYATAAWAAWLLNLGVCELILRWPRLRAGRARSRRQRSHAAGDTRWASRRAGA